jgi:hypothetical protein
MICNTNRPFLIVMPAKHDGSLFWNEIAAVLKSEDSVLEIQ